MKRKRVSLHQARILSTTLEIVPTGLASAEGAEAQQKLLSLSQLNDLDRCGMLRHEVPGRLAATRQQA